MLEEIVYVRITKIWEGSRDRDAWGGNNDVLQLKNEHGQTKFPQKSLSYLSQYKYSLVFLEWPAVDFFHPNTSLVNNLMLSI